MATNTPHHAANAMPPTTLSSLEYLLILSSTFIGQNQLSLAMPLLEYARDVLTQVVARKEVHSQSDIHTKSQNQEYRFVPTSNNAFEQPWESDFFPFPIVLQIPNRDFAATDASLAKEEMLCRYSAACLFNLGLCCQLRDRENGFSKAYDFYTRSWFCLEQTQVKPWESSMLLKKALCTNMASCHQSIGELDHARIWMEYLSVLLSESSPEFDAISPLVRKFFFVATILNGRGVAAPSA